MYIFSARVRIMDRIRVIYSVLFRVRGKIGFGFGLGLDLGLGLILCIGL